MCVSVPLVSHKLLKTKHWYVERKCKSTISRFLIGQNVKKGCGFVICSPRWLVGGDPDSCKGYPVYSRLVSTLVFHLYHERDGDAQEILIALLSKLSLLRRACYYMKGCGLTCPRARCITSSVYTLLNHNLIGVYSAGLLVCSYRNVYSCIVTSLFQQLVKI